MSLIAVLANLMVLLAGILFSVMPELSRPGILFGVPVSADFRNTEDGRRLLAAYRRAIAICTLGLITLASLALARELPISLRIGVEGILCTGCWVWSSRKTMRFADPASSIRGVSLTPQPQMLPGGWFFVLGPYLILAITASFLYANWNSIPESFPIHWARDGLPDRWAVRSVTGVFGLPLVGVLSNTLMILIALGILSGTGDIAFKRATFFLILFVDYVVSTVFAVVATRPIWSFDPIRSPSQLTPFIGTSVLALVVGVIVYLARVARSRMGAGDGTPDACWKWGVFYYNPNDSSLLVEKRIGLGWTLNFANKWAWAFMAMMLLPSILIVFGVLSAIRSTE